MQFDSTNMTSNEIRKAALLIVRADELGMDLGGYGEAAVNKSSGNVYLWLEDYPFTLYVGPCNRDRIQACWTNPETGEEEFIDAHDMTLHNLEEWAEALTQSIEEETA